MHHVPSAWVACLAASLIGCAFTIPVSPAPVAPVHCASEAPVEHAVFLVGDAGAPRLHDHTEAELPLEPVLLALKADVVSEVARVGVDGVTVVYLGDNVYPRGLVRPGEEGRAHGERVLRTLIHTASPAQVVFTAGNHDWDIQGPDGWDHVREQQAFLSRQGDRVRMLPPGGCAGPSRLDFGEQLGMVFIDPVGFSHAYTFPAMHAAVCPHRSVREAFLALAAEFDPPHDRHLVLAQHHPLITAGPHGGNFTWKQHLFPLTDFVPWLWVPLPIIGSAYPISRELGITGTDLTSSAYQIWIQSIFRATRPGSPLMFVAGHEHSLQLHRDGLGTYYVVSGAGSTRKVDRVEPLDTAMFAAAKPGYFRLDVHADGALGLTALAVDQGEHSEPVLRHCVAASAAGKASAP